MQHLEDQAGQIKAFYNGNADPAYGPIPAFPKSPFLPANAATNPYPFSVSQATSLLKANGQNYNDAASPANESKWAMMDFGGETNSTYPPQFGFLNTGGSGQLGDYSDPQADALINASTSGTNPAAVTAEASFFTTQVPVLWQPVRDRVWVWKTNISATDPTAFSNLTQYAATPEFWYTTK